LNERTAKQQFYDTIQIENLTAMSSAEEQKMWSKMSKKNGWNHPAFYFSINTNGWSKEFYQTYHPDQLFFIQKFALLTDDPTETISLYESLNQAYRSGLNTNAPSKYQRQLIKYVNEKSYKSIIEFAQTVTPNDLDLKNFTNSFITKLKDRKVANALPQISWNGAENRFHNFIFSKLLAGNLRSKIDGKPIFKKIWPAVSITLFINLFALVIVLFFGIRLGRYLYEHPTSKQAKIWRVLLYVFFAMPLFWLATLVLMAAPGNFFSGIPSLQPGETPSILTFLRPRNLGFLVLPVLSIVLNVTVVVAIHMYRSLRDTGQQKFMLAAQTRGISARQLIRNHNQPVAMFSILTVVGNSIPALISGSVVIEIIFNLPGIGRLLWQSLYGFDWTVVTGLLFFSIIFSVVGQLLTDLAYQVYHPEMTSQT